MKPLDIPAVPVEPMPITPELRSRVRPLVSVPYWAIARVLLDFVIWISTAWLALTFAHPWFTGVAVFFIGFVPMHDVLIFGHESTHRMISRTTWLNEFFLWLNHALFGVSGTAHRAFHLTHHRYAHSPRDPEYHILQHLWGAHGRAYLIIPLIAPALVNLYPFISTQRRLIRRHTARDLFGALALHLGLLWVLGVRNYFLFIQAPLFSGLGLAFILRSVCEHHATAPGSRWTYARTTNVPKFFEFLWSNINYHLEHHLFPKVPFHRLPALRRILKEEFEKRGVVIEQGYLKSAWVLLREPVHFNFQSPHEEKRQL